MWPWHLAILPPSTSHNPFSCASWWWLTMADTPSSTRCCTQSPMINRQTAIKWGEPSCLRPWHYSHSPNTHISHVLHMQGIGSCMMVAHAPHEGIPHIMCVATHLSIWMPRCTWLIVMHAHGYLQSEWMRVVVWWVGREWEVVVIRWYKTERLGQHWMGWTGLGWVGLGWVWVWPGWLAGCATAGWLAGCATSGRQPSSK